MKKSLYDSVPRILRWVIACAVSITLVPPVEAEVVVVDPGEPPDVILPPAEAERLAALLDAQFPYLFSEINPKGTHAIAYLPSEGIVFFNVRTAQTSPIDFELFNFNWLTDFRWQDSQTVIFIGADFDGGIHLVQIDRGTGAVTATPLELPGYPLDLSPNGRRVLLYRWVEPLSDPTLRGPASAPALPFKTITLAPGYRRPGPAVFDTDERLRIKVATAHIELSVFDLQSGDEHFLLEMAPEVGIPSIAWSPRGNRLAIVRSQFPDFSRGGGIPVDGASVQDALGNLPTEENPFFTENVFDLFAFHGDHLHRQQLFPEPAKGEAFLFAEWDPSGHLILMQTFRPGTPAGRRYPTWGNPNRTSYRLYSAGGRLLRELPHPEIDGLSSMGQFLSTFEVVFTAPEGVDHSLYHYHLLTGRLRRLPTADGSIHQTRLNRRRGEIVYSASSFEHPYELFHHKRRWDAPRPLTDINAELAEVNQVRVDPVQFTLSSGTRRIGYLVQPAGAQFPPSDIPLVIWQQGGPTASMLNSWGGSVESPFNILPNFGISVLMVPLPGRDGFEPDFLDGLADDRNFGQIDIDEQIEIIEQLIAAGITSPEQLGITGCSYGGYFAGQSITTYPTAYAAANPQCTLLDLFHEWEFGYKPYMSYLMGRTPLDDPDEYYLDSPFQRADQVQTPTLIFSGSHDFLPAEFSHDFHDAINATGTPADYYEFVGEGHGLGQYNSQFVAAQAQIEWFRNYLQM